MTDVLVPILRESGTLGKLDGDIGGNRSPGGRGGAKSFDRNLLHTWRRMTSEVEMNMVVAGH